MKRKQNRFKIIGILLVALSITVGAQAMRLFRHISITPKSTTLPTATPYIEKKIPLPPKPSAIHQPPTYQLPSQINLAVPFVSQAPKKNWDADHEEFCEEASSLMAAHYIQNIPVASPDAADSELLQIKTFEETAFGFFKDTDADFTVRILKEFYHLDKVTTLNNPTIEDIKTNLAANKTVLVPAAGRMLGNPHFSGQGPLYHMIILKGYTADGNFITNDPGTQFGADYVYSFSRIMNAMHDWNDGNVNQGKKVIIIVG